MCVIMDQENKEQNLLDLISFYRKTQEYQTIKDILEWDVLDWPRWLNERVRKQKGRLSIEESLFIFTFFTEPGKDHLNTWLNYIQEHGVTDQRINSEKTLSMIKKSIIENDRVDYIKIIEDNYPTQTSADNVINYFQKAMEKGFIETTGWGLKWNGTKAQLAYFLGHFLIDGLFPEKFLGGLFNETRLAQAFYRLADNKTGGGKPRGYEKIDAIFEE